MLALLCPKVIVNIAIPVLRAASTLAQHLGMLNTFFQHITLLALVIASVTGWLAQPTELLYGMVKRPLGRDINTMHTSGALNSFCQFRMHQEENFSN